MTVNERKQFEVEELQAKYEIQMQRARNAYSDFMAFEATAGKMYRELQEKRGQIEDSL
jgi:hypothetical protein